MKPNPDPEDNTTYSPAYTDRDGPGRKGYDANDNPELEVTEFELAALRDEVDVLHSGDIKEAADNLLAERTLSAIISISKLATEATAERVRLDASKYIVERVLGPLSKMEFEKDPNKDPIYKLLLKAGMIKDD